MTGAHDRSSGAMQDPTDERSSRRLRADRFGRSGRWAALLAIAALAFAQGAGEAQADEHGKRIDDVSVEDMDTTGGTVTTAVTTAGPSALDRIQAARQAIASDDLATARSKLTEAQEQLQQLRSQNPSAPVQDALRAAHEALENEGAEAAIARLEPVSQTLVVQDDYDEALAQVQVETSTPRYVAGRKAHEHIAKALESMRQNDVEQAEVELDAAEQTAVYTEVDLPVNAAYYEVKLALQALADGHPEIADQQLAAAESQARTLVATAQRGATQMDVDVAAPPR